MKIQKRVSLKRRNFLPTFLIAIFSWAMPSCLIFFYAPDTSFLIFLFYLLIFVSIFLTASLVLGNSRRGFLFSAGMVSFLFLKQVKQAHFLNFFLVGGILFSIELYFRKK